MANGEGSFGMRSQCRTPRNVKRGVINVRVHQRVLIIHKAKMEAFKIKMIKMEGFKDEAW